jgi:hypothetical protein
MGLVENESEFTNGNFSIESLDDMNNALFNISFNLSFILSSSDGNTTRLNVTPFVFVIPMSNNISRIVFKKNETVIETRNRTQNKPNVTLLSPNGGELFNNDIINITWNATDADNDTLFYAILFSKDNGITYNTLIFDYNETQFAVSSNEIMDCKECVIKILATDGFNTGNDTSDNLFEIDNDMNVTEFDVIFTNETQRVFRVVINNTLDMNITNISWDFETGEDIKTSQYKISLQQGEDVFIYIYHNYSFPGSYNVVATARSGEFAEVESINIIV